MSDRTLYIDGLAMWSPSLPGWEWAGPALRGEAPPALPAPARPAPPQMAPNERRRASDAVLLALEVAGRALAASGHDSGAIGSVFTSAHGDLAITDALCRTLAVDPLALSPTRFVHSVHNAPSGHWAIASRCRAASTALSCEGASFAVGLLEAATQCACEDEPRLLVGTDTAACGALASVNHSRGLLAVALVLAPRRGPASRWALRWALEAGTAAGPGLRSAAAWALAGNAMADALPLFEVLAAGAPARIEIGLSSGLRLALGLDPIVCAPVAATAA